MGTQFYISTSNAPFFVNNIMGYSDSIPVSGTYKVGDFIISSIQTDNVFGWVCTVAGTPGTWEVIGSGKSTSEILNSSITVEKLSPEVIKIINKQENEIRDLKDEVTVQEETIATISYDLMMLQKPIKELLVGNSPKFNMIKIWYKKGFWTTSMVQDAATHGWLTKAEVNEIIGF